MRWIYCFIVLLVVFLLWPSRKRVEKLRPKKTRPIVFFATTFIDEDASRVFVPDRTCPFNCTFTSDRDYAPLSDVRVFHPTEFHGYFPDDDSNALNVHVFFESPVQLPVTSGRAAYLKELEKHIEVTKVGKCYSNHVDSLDQLVDDHHFFLAFENSICKYFEWNKTLKTREPAPGVYEIDYANLSCEFCRLATQRPKLDAVNIESYWNKNECGLPELEMSGAMTRGNRIPPHTCCAACQVEKMEEQTHKISDSVLISAIVISMYSSLSLKKVQCVNVNSSSQIFLNENSFTDYPKKWKLIIEENKKMQERNSRLVDKVSQLQQSPKKSLNENTNSDPEASGSVKKTFKSKLQSKLNLLKKSRDDFYAKCKRNPNLLSCCAILGIIFLFICLVTAVQLFAGPLPLKKVQCVDVNSSSQIVSNEDRFTDDPKKLKQQMELIIGQNSILAERLEKSEAKAQKLMEQVAELTKQSKTSNTKGSKSAESQQSSQVDEKKEYVQFAKATKSIFTICVYITFLSLIFESIIFLFKSQWKSFVGFDYSFGTTLKGGAIIFCLFITAYVASIGLVITDGLIKGITFRW
ncbi:Glyco-tran-10-N domain-containing protein [Aphelenchoides besseyi]|nr:Glyco-tran-10-N domain-containing protein [Aphelenchoides besseyi]